MLVKLIIVVAILASSVLGRKEEKEERKIENQGKLFLLRKRETLI